MTMGIGTNLSTGKFVKKLEACVEGFRMGEARTTSIILKYIDNAAKKAGETYSSIFNLEYEETQDELICYLYELVKIGTINASSYFLFHLKGYARNYLTKKISNMYGLTYDDVNDYCKCMVEIKDLGMESVFEIADEATLISLGMSFENLERYKAIHTKVANRFMDINCVVCNTMDDHLTFIAMKSAVYPMINSMQNNKLETVLLKRFGFEDGRMKTLSQIGSELNFTGEYIRELEAKALRKLRHPSRRKFLEDLL